MTNYSKIKPVLGLIFLTILTSLIIIGWTLSLSYKKERDHLKEQLEFLENWKGSVKEIKILDDSLKIWRRAVFFKDSFLLWRKAFYLELIETRRMDSIILKEALKTKKRS